MALRDLENLSELDFDSLLDRWNVLKAARGPASLDVYRSLGERSLRLGEPLLAYDILSEGLLGTPDHPRLLQLFGLALTRSGSSRRANEVLTALESEGRADAETLGLLARTHKDLAREATSPEERRRELELALGKYQEAYDRFGEYYPGINAATVATVLGQRERAQALAREVRALCLALLPQSRADRYWTFATLGEAALILGEPEEARRWYTEAVREGGGALGDLASTRRSAKFLAEHIGGDEMKRMNEVIDACLRVPSVMVFTGHMIDRPGRPVPRFPGALEGAVKSAIHERIEAAGAAIGYASAACGADILFLEALLERKGEIRIVLPYGRERFLRDSVDIIPGADWPARWERVLGSAAEVLVAAGHLATSSSILYDYMSLLLLGLSTLRARQLDTRLTALAVWDGKSGDGPGGTESVVREWRARGCRVEHIDLERHEEAAVSLGPRQIAAPQKFATEIVAILLADLVGFSSLADDQIPLFIEHVLGAIARLIAATNYPPVLNESRGDGYLLIFSNVRDAGRFALDLADRMASTDWLAKGFPSELRLRVGLHAGPVYAFTDPVTRLRTYTGAHIVRAARIEPITPPGQVYGSQAFAALAAAERVTEFTCDYVGRIPLAKLFGTTPVYRLRRRDGAAAPEA